MVGALVVGRFRVPISLGDVVEVLAAKLTGRTSEIPPALQIVIFNLRMPRVLAAVIVGAALAMAGAAFQGLFRNPLASPDILGVSSGGALGAVLGVYWHLSLHEIALMSFAGGLLAVAIVYFAASRLAARDPILVLVLSGVVIAALFSAGAGYVRYIADPTQDLPLMTYLLIGGLDRIRYVHLAAIVGPVALGTAVLFVLRWRMNALSLPEEEARALGLPTGMLRTVIIVAATLLTAASVAISGIIGWVGLVVPHLARALVGPDFSRLIPASAILGGGYLLLIDTLARSASASETPLGILTAVIGTPFFFWLLTRMQRTWS
jgi:iron complex transport system permease protein